MNKIKTTILCVYIITFTVFLNTAFADYHPCVLCGENNYTKIHSGTRDNESLDVLKCNKCGLVSLSDFKHITDTFYQDSGMRDFNVDFKLEESLSQTKSDDLRRAESLKEFYENKNLLDFGCGNGGFLNYARPYCKKVCGIELEESVVNKLIEKGIDVRKNINEFDDNFEVITMFHVIEHLVDPLETLEQIKQRMGSDTKLIIETPNSDDALLSLYKSEAFADFTYWSPHVNLYNTNTLEKLLEKAGFKIVWSKQIQRYPLSNHLYWLSHGKPGGHEKWKDFNSKVLNSEYEQILKDKKICDTLLICVEKQ